jgi:hypothetical protein
MHTKEEAAAFLDQFEPDHDRQGFQAEISSIDYERLNFFKAGLFRGDQPLRYVGKNRSAQNRHSPGAWTFETEDGFARAHIVFDWRDAKGRAYMTVELAGEPIWIDREPFRADLHQFAALWQVIPHDVKEEYRWYSTNTLGDTARKFVDKLDRYRKPGGGKELPSARSEREVIEGLLSRYDEDDEEAEISVTEWEALDAFKQSLSFADPEGYTITEARPEMVGEQLWLEMTSADGFVKAYFIYDDAPSYWASITLAGEPYWGGYDPNECTEEQRRAIYAMLPEESKEHIRSFAVKTSQDYYANMIEDLTGTRPEVDPRP